MRRRRRWRLPKPLTTVAVIAAVAFALGSVGSPLLGMAVFAGTDELATRSPYLDAGFAGRPVRNQGVDDTYTAQLPNTLLYTQSVRDGDPAQWNPYVSGGIPLGASVNYALFDPLTLPYYLLPGWLAPGYEKLLEILCAIAGGFLFLRRIRLGRPAALLGGTIFAGTAFMVAWTNWPQTRVAAFIPWVFWAAERLVQRRRVGDAALLAVPIGFMLLGGFPAVTAYTLLTAAGYVVVRLLAEYRHRPRRLLGVLAAAAGSVAGGVALAAVQLVPFVGFYRHWLIEGRGQTPADHLHIADLATLFAPWTFGGWQSSNAGKPIWYLPLNMIESLSYLGAAALVLVLVAVALPGAGRRLLPRSAWLYLVLVTGGWLLVIYTGGPLRLLRHLPVFSSNFVGRARSVLGFLLAVLAAVGFEVLLRRRAERRAGAAGVGSGRPAARSRVARLAWPVAVWVGAAGVLAVVWSRARHAAGTAHSIAGQSTAFQLDYATRQLLLGLVFVALSLAAAALLYWAPVSGGRRWSLARFGAAGLLPVLVASQALTLAVPFYPRTDRATFYPTTDVQTFLAAHLGQQRFAGTWTAMFMGSESPRRLRALTGHGFVNEEFAALVRAIPDDPMNYPTYINLTASPEVVHSPVLDTLGVRYLVTSPRDPVFGTPHTAVGDGGSQQLRPGQTVTVPVPEPGPLRAVGVTPVAAYTPPAGPAQAQDWIAVTVRDAASGAVVATAKRLTLGIAAGTPFLVPVAADRVAAGARLTAELTAHTAAPLTVATTAGGPPSGRAAVPGGPRLAVSTVSGGDDGLVLAHAGSSVIWDRLTAQPRIRWASRATVEPDTRARVGLLARGVAADQVVLDAPGPPAEGRPASVRTTQDGTDRISTTVDAQGAGYLVVADADQVGWAATVDGRPAALVPADQGVVAVPVPAGRHTVTLHYAAPYAGSGTWTTVVAIVLLVATAGASWWRRRVETR